jgi:hypothetical protein
MSVLALGRQIILLWDMGLGSTPHLQILGLRATSHTRLRAQDKCTSSTLVGGKGGAGPSSLHTTLEGPTEHVNARWMSSLHGFLHGIKWTMCHGHLDYFQKSSLGGRFNTKIGRPCCIECSQSLIYSNLSCVRTHMNKHVWGHSRSGYYFPDT